MQGQAGRGQDCEQEHLTECRVSSRQGSERYAYSNCCEYVAIDFEDFLVDARGQGWIQALR
jgi:hypothetical protein